MEIVTERVKGSRDLKSIKNKLVKVIKDSSHGSSKTEPELSKAIKDKFGFTKVNIYVIEHKDPILQLSFTDKMIEELKMNILNNQYRMSSIQKDVRLIISRKVFQMFSVNEILAAIIHEVGHIIYIDEYKNVLQKMMLNGKSINLGKKDLEYDADSLTVYYGLDEDLKKFLHKYNKKVKVSGLKGRMVNLTNIAIDEERRNHGKSKKLPHTYRDEQ